MTDAIRKLQLRMQQRRKHGPAFDRGAEAGAVQITLADRVTPFHNSAIRTAFSIKNWRGSVSAVAAIAAFEGNTATGNPTS